MAISSATGGFTLPGLVLVTTCTCSSGGTASNGVVTIGSAQTSVVVDNAFSSTFDTYRIVVNGSTASGGGNNIYLKFNNSTGSTYNMAGWYMTYGSSTITGFNRSASNVGMDIALTGTSSWSVSSDIFNPYATSVTNVVSQCSASGIVSNYMGYDSNAASSTGFSLTVSGGTITGGTIRVYGYRN